ncbi:AAA family ATPase [Candidatus Micrarchaeota archaeon]|nr:AAA family ATPase [Candidatus Micrarchaeota archaeon]MBD3417500.1 AAA family ATPase [Candidatus Micrarchaeota archaeon]
MVYKPLSHITRSGISMIIGLTGENCAGKGTVAEYLKTKGFLYRSLSDVLREELKAEGKELTRENLIEKGNSLRAEHGPAALAKKTVERLEEGTDYIIDSIRNAAEAQEIKSLPNSTLVYVRAPPEVRFERMKARGRESDPQTFEEFQRLEAREMKNEDKTKQSLVEAFEIADLELENIGSIEELHKKIDELLGSL